MNRCERAKPIKPYDWHYTCTLDGGRCHLQGCPVTITCYKKERRNGKDPDR